MYQQGHPGDPNGAPQDDRAWYVSAPRFDASGGKRRSRSRAQNSAQQPDPAASGYQQPAAPAQQGYSYAANGFSHPADVPGYQNSRNQQDYSRQSGYSQQGGYNQQNQYADPAYNGGYAQEDYARQNAYGQQGGYNQQDYSRQGGYGQQNGYADPAYSNACNQGDYAQQNAYGQQGGYPQQNGYADPAYNGGYAQEDYARQNAYGQQSGYPGQGGYQGGYVPPRQPRQPRQPDQPEDRAARIKGLAVQAAAILVVLVLVAVWVTISRGGGSSGNNNGNGNGGQQTTQQGGLSTNRQGDVSDYANCFLPNVYVDGLCLTDMTFEEGSQAVWAQANAKQSGWYVRLKNESGSYKDITADMLGISFDPTSALQQAWAVGHTPDANGQVTEKALRQSVADALMTEYHFTSAQQSANTTPIDTILNTLQTNAYRAPQDAVILSFNPDDFVNPFTFQQEVWGQWLDITAVKQEILNMVSTLESGEVLLQTTPIAPNVTVADLQKTVSLRCRAVTPISSSSTEERTNNIRVAFAKINGKSFAHGDKFSFNKLVGRRSLENGFFEAIEYAYGEEVMGVGGGVCQASTTVYLAAIQSGMTITTRDAHSNPVNYTSLGMDATVSDTRGREVDFAFRNESGGRIFIAAHVVESGSNGRSLLCEVRIYGPALDDVHYKLESVTIEVLPKPEEPKLKEDKTGEKAFYVDETKLASKGREGYVVETYLCTYQGDELISRDKVSTDTYPARQDVYWVGVNQR